MPFSVVGNEPCFSIRFSVGTLRSNRNLAHVLRGRRRGLRTWHSNIRRESVAPRVVRASLPNPRFVHALNSFASRSSASLAIELAPALPLPQKSATSGHTFRQRRAAVQRVVHGAYSSFYGAKARIFRAKARHAGAWPGVSVA